MNTRKQIKSVIIAMLLAVMPLVLIGCESTNSVSQGLQTDNRTDLADQHALADTQDVWIDMYTQ